MKNFEEQYTAWLDGVLDGAERTDFEAALPNREAALRDAAEWKTMRGLLRETLVPTAMPHPDFVNNQVLEAIRRDAPSRREPAKIRGWQPVGFLAWTGAALLVLAGALSFLSLSPNEGAPDPDRFISQVIAAHATDPKLGAYAFAAPGGRGAVLWVNDAGYIPANEKIK
ncbi:MAG: hypothetical protein PHC88_13260 [Terrimicrobiaceae bacterium]|nr:hypothetical protein [Terrimicrobiaceae bacterium]